MYCWAMATGRFTPNTLRRGQSLGLFPCHHGGRQRRRPFGPRGSIADYSSPGLFSIFVSRGLGVILNNGDGTFGNFKIYDHAGFAIAGIDAADFNRDA